VGFGFVAAAADARRRFRRSRAHTPNPTSLTRNDNNTNSTGATLINEDAGGEATRAHGGAHVTALAWVPAVDGDDASAAPPRLLTGGLDKRVRLWGAAAGGGNAGTARLTPTSTSWQAPKKISAVAAVDVRGAGGEQHVFFADRYGDVLCAPLSAGAGAEGEGGNNNDLPSALALGHLSSSVSRVLAVPESGGNSSGTPNHHHPALVATADADGKVRLSRVPSDAAFLARHGCPEMQAYALGHQSAVVDLALLRLPVGWVRGGEGGGEEGGDATTTTTTPVVVSGGADGTVRLWCPATGKELCRAVVVSEGAEEEGEKGEGGRGSEGGSDGGDGSGSGSEEEEEQDEESAAARQALERMQRLEAALSPGDDDCLREPRCPSVAAVAAAAQASSSHPPLVAAAVEGQHAVAVFAVERKEGSRLSLRMLRRSPVPGVRFPTSLQFAPVAGEGASRPLLLWAAGGWPSAALLAGAPVSEAAGAAAVDASADVGVVDALTGEELGGGVAPAAGLGVLRRRRAEEQEEGDGPSSSPLPAYPVPLLWQRREAERRRQGRAHGSRLKRGRVDFAETARLAKLHGGGGVGGGAEGGGGGGGGGGEAAQ
jgi:hypothetical protein